MKIKIASWNVAGANILKIKKKKREEKINLYNQQLETLIQRASPDIVVLQELAAFSEKNNSLEYQFNIPEGYYMSSSMAIDTFNNSYPPKWNKIRQSGAWDKEAYLGVGLGMLWKKELYHSSLWNMKDSGFHCGAEMEKEVVRFETGLFTGNRNTEPRLAMIAHFKLGDRHLFIINFHLTTLQKEREGHPQVDMLGSRIRELQIDTIFNGIISRLNQDLQKRFENSNQEKSIIWILAGDLNATEKSSEAQYFEQMNFSRLCGDQATKRRKKTTTPSIKVDYIFAGPRDFAIDQKIIQNSVKSCQVFYDLDISDHYPIVAPLEI